MSLTLKSFAKLNLNLTVFEKATNNLHPISSVFQEINLHDDLTIALSPSTTPKLTLTCSGFKMPLDNTNVLSTIFQSLIHSLKHDYKIHIHKRIPLGSGMGGASSNAATFLKAINSIEKLNWDNQFLTKQSELFGSDIAFFINGKTQHVSSFGNILRSLPTANPKQYYTIIYPNFHCSTKDIYSHFDYMNDNGLFKLTQNEFKKNSLFETVIDLYPEMQHAYSMLKKQTNEPLYLTGSGSTFFIIHKNLDHAARITTEIQKKHSEFYIKLVADV